MCPSQLVGMPSTIDIITERLVLSGWVGLPPYGARQAGTFRCLHIATARPAHRHAPSLLLGMCVLQPVFQCCRTGHQAAQEPRKLRQLQSCG